MKMFKKAICFVIISSILTTYAAAYENENNQHIFTEGIVHKEIRYDDYFGDGSGRKEVFNVLEVDFSKEGVSALTTISNNAATGVQTLGEQAYAAIERGKNVVAGINCDMYAMDSIYGPGVGIPSCVTIVDGVIYSTPLYKNSFYRLPVFTVDENNSPDIKYLSLDITINIDRNGTPYTYNTWLFNRNFGTSDGIIVFNSKISSDGILEILTKSESNVGIDLSKASFFTISGVEGASDAKAGITYSGTIESCEKYDGNNKFNIPDDGFLIVDLNSKMYSGMYAKTAEITFNLNEVDDKGNIIAPANNIVQSVGAYNWIVKDGIAQTIEMYEEAHFPAIDRLVTASPARTGIGIKADGTVVAATVDVRVWESDGMTMEEWGEFFKSLGCVEAVNFDGGGSTEMVAIGDNSKHIITVNKPSNNESREISTGLLFTADNVRLKGITQPIIQPRTLMVIIATVVIAVPVGTASVVIILRQRRRHKNLSK